MLKCPKLTHVAHRSAILMRLQADQRSIDSYIVDRAEAALQVLKKQHHVEEVRQQYRVALTVLAPTLDKAGCQDAMQKKVAARLGVDRNGAPFRDAVAKRHDIDKMVCAREQCAGFQVGERVLCKHGVGVLIALDSEDGPNQVFAMSRTI